MTARARGEKRMRSLSQNTKDARSSRLQAAGLLRLPGLRLHLILAAMLCLCFWVGIVYVCECMFAAVPWEILREQSPLWYTLLDQAFYLVDAAVILLVGIPLAYGACMIYMAAADGESAPFTTLFCAFEGPRTYLRAQGVMLGLLLPVLAVAGVAWHLVDLANRSDLLWLSCLYYGLTILLVVGACSVLGLNDGVLRLSYLHPDHSLFGIFSASQSATRGRLWSLFFFKLRYIGWAILSVLTLGILLIFHALPSFALAHTTHLGITNESNTST
jgi:hypothetical protein